MSGAVGGPAATDEIPAAPDATAAPDSSDPLSLTLAYRARFDECGPDGTLRSAGLMRWAQDCAWIHSERLGFTRDWYAARGLWWVVRCAELNVLGAVALGETVSVTTTLTGYRRVWVRRRTEVTRASGERVAAVLTDWVITNGRGAPIRVPDDFLAPLGTRVQTFTPGRVVLPPPPPGAAREEVVVRNVDIDPMAHMNSAAYLDELEECLLAAGRADWLTRVPRRYRVEYVSAAALGERLAGETWSLGGGIAHRLLGPDGAERMIATVDDQTLHDDFREAVRAARPLRAPGKDAGAGQVRPVRTA